MGESSAPRRPTHDTNTSRREVKITHTHKTQTYKDTMKITGLIASTMLLLMASAPSGLLASPESGDILSDYKNQVEQELLRSVDVLDPLPHLTLMDQSYSDPLFSFGLPDNINELLLSEALGNLQQDVPAPRGRKLALIPLADLADIGLGVQKIINPTNGQVNSNDVRGLANTLQKYLPFPFLATGRQGSRGGGSSRKPTGGKPTGRTPTGRTPTQGGGGEGEEGR